MYTDKNGHPSAFPIGKKAAYAEKCSAYNCGYICEHCGISPYRYTHTDDCYTCARLDALDFYNLAHGLATTQYRYGHIYKVTLPRRSSRFLTRKQSDKLRNGLARLRPSPGSFKVTAAPCAKAGHIGLQDHKGRCVYCQELRPSRKKSPRQEAIAQGLKFYTPATPCKHCGQYRPRTVYTGQCECQKAGKYTGNAEEIRATIQAMAGCIVTRKEAQKLGLLTYSTDGKTWRYMSCGNPIKNPPATQ